MLCASVTRGEGLKREMHSAGFPLGYAHDHYTFALIYMAFTQHYWAKDLFVHGELFALFFGFTAANGKSVIQKVGIRLDKRNGPLVHMAMSEFATVEAIL